MNSTPECGGDILLRAAMRWNRGKERVSALLSVQPFAQGEVRDGYSVYTLPAPDFSSCQVRALQGEDMAI